jgi:hypothetical protein
MCRWRRREVAIVSGERGIGGRSVGKRRANEKGARAPKINEFEHEDVAASAGRYERNAAKARTETGLEPVLAEDLSADEEAALEKAWPLQAPTPVQSARARAKSRQPRV